MKVLIHFDSHSTEATATRLRRVYPTWYAHSEHFAMHLFEDTRIGSPEFDEGSPVTWEVIE